MKLEDIGFYTLSDERAKNSSIYSPLYRAEIILTNKCNFHCPYCRGLKGNDISFEEAKKTLTYWLAEGLKNIRFSGGEPTLHPYLSELVYLCKVFGLEHIAISTNGSAHLNYYKLLLDRGVNDFSISLDACCSETGEIMSGVKNIFPNILDNIKYLASKTYTTVGIVVNENNLKEVSKTILLAHSLGVSDIRIITSTQYNKNILNEVIQNTDVINDKAVLFFHPILKYRVFNKRNMRGMIDTDSRKCKLVLDDMAVWNGYHYPCIIYLREQGLPIGKVSYSMRKERQDWYENHNSWEDNICKNNCLDVCILHNNKGEE